MSAKSQLVLGIMSGTSVDGADYALCRISEQRVQLVKLWSAKFPAPLRQRIHCAARNDASCWEVAQLHHDLGRFYAKHARAGAPKLRPHYVGLHGQTVFHRPHHRDSATLQLGEPAYLAEAINAPVVSNFRAGDLAAGGQGAPLATAFHVRVFAREGLHVCVNNLGGISNVTSIDWRRGAKPRVMAFDTGPANVLMDLAMRHFSGGRVHFDQGGRRAARGRVCKPLVRRWLEHPFFQAKPPKSTGRELFGEPFFETVIKQANAAALSKPDLMASLAALTAKSVALNYRLHLPCPPDAVILSGGGASNAELLRLMAAEFRTFDHDTTVMTSEEGGWPVQSIEAAAFALLAWLRMNGRPGNVPATTGASREVCLGQVTPP